MQHWGCSVNSISQLEAGGLSVAIDLPTESPSPPNGGFLMLSPKWGIQYPVSSAMVCASEANASISHTTRPRPMTNQTQAADQVLTDEQLEDLNGAGPVSDAFWEIDNIRELRY